MKKIITLLLTVVLGMSVLTGCGEKEATQTNVTESKEDVTTITEEVAADNVSDRTTFIVGFDASFPPYGYMDENGEYVGFDLDLAAEVCARMGWELVLQPIEWASKDMELSSGSIDCIWNGFTMSADRVEKYAWSSPYVDNSQVFVVAADAGISKQADLADKVVAVQSDSSALEALNAEESEALKASFAELMEVADYNTAFMNLEAGAVDAVAMDYGVANYQIASRGDEFVVLEEALASEVYGIGFLLGEEDLRDAVQTTLNDMVSDGKFMEIAEKWGLESSVILGK